MLKIGEFSRLSHLTVKALRFYEKEKLLIPASVDEWTGYRFYETSQLEDAARIKAFNNLYRDINYRWSESKEPGVYGILAGGDFEAESLCLDYVWKNLSDDLNDDLIVCAPTKDIVLYTKSSDKKLVKKILKMASDMFESNRKETPHLLFCKDVFVFDRKSGHLEISMKYSF